MTLEDLADEQFVVVPSSSSSPGYGPLFALCQKAGFEPSVVQEVSNNATQLNLITVGMGVGLITTGRNFIYPASISVVPLSGISYTTSFIFGWVKGESDPALDRMIEIIKDLAR